VIFELIEDLAKLALIVASLYFALGAYVRRTRPAWSGPLERRRLMLLSVLVLAVSAIKVSEEAIGGESGPIDQAILLFIHRHVPGGLTGFFEAVTLTGSSKVLFPLATAATIALLFARRRLEALLLAASVIGGAALVYVVKALVGRARPALCASRIRPAARKLALSIAILWISLVAISRLVLGVHWPTDVLAAACIGTFLPLAMSVGLELRYA